MNLLLAVLGLIVRRLSTSRIPPVTPEWIDRLSVDRYRPMLRLFDESDLQFVGSRSGFHSRAAADWRARRSRIFRGYLESLRHDFQRTCSALQHLLRDSNCGRPELASALVRAQIRFALGVAVVQVRVALYRLGAARVDARSLVKLFEGVRAQLGALIPVSTGAMALDSDPCNSAKSSRNVHATVTMAA